jgi:hypothetical protein
MRIAYWVTIVWALFVLSAPLATAVEIFWNDHAGIHRLRPGGPPSAMLFQTYDSRGLELNAADNQLLWSDILPLGAPIPGGVIRAGGTAGGEITDLARELPSPAAVAFDAPLGKIYWTDLGDDQHASAVFSANRDGSDVRPLIRGDWLSEIAGIAIDSRHKHLYFTFVNPLLDSLFAGGIARADLDGSNAEVVVSGLVKPLGIAVDGAGGNIYWAHARGLGDQVDGAIESADLDGQGRRVLLGGLERPYDVALDVAAQNIYWTDMASGKIQRTHMSGILPFFEDVVTGLDSPTAITLIPEPTTQLLLTCGALLLLYRRPLCAGP